MIPWYEILTSRDDSLLAPTWYRYEILTSGVDSLLAPTWYRYDILTSRVVSLFAVGCWLLALRWDVVGHLQGYGRAVDVHFTTVGAYNVSSTLGVHVTQIS